MLLYGLAIERRLLIAAVHFNSSKRDSPLSKALLELSPSAGRSGGILPSPLMPWFGFMFG